MTDDMRTECGSGGPEGVRWDIGDHVAVGRDGRPLDGQHRLAAVFRAMNRGEAA